MKLNTYAPLLILLLVFSPGAIKAQEEFLYAVVELHKTDLPGQYAVDIQLTNVVEARLKKPSKSVRIQPFDVNYVSFQITDDNDNILDEINFKDPFKIRYEYVNEQGLLDHAVIDTDMRSYVVRRPITKSATQLRVVPHSAIRNQNSVTKKFRE